MKNKMRRMYVVLGFILILATFLRFYQLGKVPISPDWDEVSLGYNAYSILKTGKDEYGATFPVVLRSFDDYKPALYAYVIIPFISVMGLNDITVRIPSAIAGVFAVLGTFLLVRQLFENLQIQKKKVDVSFALLSAFLVAISPWDIQFSRIAFESQVGFCINIFVFLFFLKGIKNPKLLVLSFILGALNFHMYQSNRVFTPLLLGVLSVIYYKDLLKIKKWYVISCFIFGLILLPFVFYLFANQNALLRAKGVSVFSNDEIVARSAKKLMEDSASSSIIGPVIDNRRLEYVKSIVSGYISHADLGWLFINGDLARHHAPDMGLLYLMEFPFLLLGIYVLLFAQYDKRAKMAFFGYLLLVPIPASVTTGVPHAVRTLNFVSILEICVAAGILLFYFSVKKIKLSFVQYGIYAVITILFLINIGYYLDQYFVQQNYYNSKYWQYGYKEAVGEVKKIEDNYSKIIVSNQPHLDQSYMFFLFYLLYDPSLYQKQSQDSSGGFKENHTFGKYEFRPIDWQNEEKTSRVLYVGRPEDFSGGYSVIKKIDFLDGEPAILIVQR